MTYQDFIEQVQQRTGLEREEAERESKAFFETLAARIDQNEADHLASQLPLPLKETLLEQGDRTEKLQQDGFFERIGAAGNRTGEEILEHSRAVWETLGEAVEPGLLDHVRSQLPADITAALDGDQA